MRKAAVSGGTGFIGRRLCAILPPANVLTRNPAKAPPDLASAACFRWRPEKEQPPPESLDGCDAVFHLAGEPVAKGRWTAAKKQRIRDSRVLGTRNLVAGLRTLRDPPSVLVSASAVGFYGSRSNEELIESSDPGKGFLAEVCQEWESEALRAESFGIRVVCVRIGLVLGREGGALGRMLPPFKLGLGGRLGTGKQWMPWIHVADLARLFVFASEMPDLRGPVNGVAPGAVTNREFTTALARAVNRPALFPAPAFALRLALGAFAEVLLASQRVLPRAAEQAGFRFRHEKLSSALRSL